MAVRNLVLCRKNQALTSQQSFACDGAKIKLPNSITLSINSFIPPIGCTLTLRQCPGIAFSHLFTSQRPCPAAATVADFARIRPAAGFHHPHRG